MKRTALVIVVLVAALILCVLITIIGFKPSMGKTAETWEVENRDLRLRVEMHLENCFAVCGAYYLFQSANVGSDNWKEIFIAHHDDPNPIPRENLQFVNSQVAYVFFGPKYAVTTDAGKSWMVWDAWDANKGMRFEKHNLYPSIVRVSITSDGRGEMSLYPISDSTANRPKLKTTDYGRSWNWS
jgi:hypothetical protein